MRDIKLNTYDAKIYILVNASLREIDVNEMEKNLLNKNKSDKTLIKGGSNLVQIMPNLAVYLIKIFF